MNTRIVSLAILSLFAQLAVGCFSPGDCTVADVADSSCLDSPSSASGGNGNHTDPTATEPVPTTDGPDTAPTTTDPMEQVTTTVNPSGPDPDSTSNPMESDSSPTGSDSDSTTDAPDLCVPLTCGDHPTARGCDDANAPLSLGDLFDDVWSLDAAFASCDCSDEQKQSKIGLITCLGLGNAQTDLGLTATSCDEQKLLDLIATGPTQRLTMSGDPGNAVVNATQVWTTGEGCGFTAVHPLQVVKVAAYQGDCQKNGPGIAALPLTAEVRYKLNGDVVSVQAPLPDGNVELNLGDKPVSSPDGHVTGVNLMAASSEPGSFCVTFNDTAAYHVVGKAPTLMVN